jgi:hypothetical protein
MILQAFYLWFIGLGLALCLSVLLIVIYFYFRHKKLKKCNSKRYIHKDDGRYWEIDGVFLPQSDINHYIYYYRY